MDERTGQRRKNQNLDKLLDQVDSRPKEVDLIRLALKDIQGIGKARTSLKKYRPFSTGETKKIEGEKKVKLDKGKFVFDEVTLRTVEKEELQRLKESLKEAVRKNDNKAIRRITWYLEDSKDDESQLLLRQIQEAVELNDPDKITSINSLDIKLPSRSLAEKRMIKDELEKEIAKLPFEFLDAAGKKLDIKDVDFVLVQEKGGFKLMIGSKKGGGIVRLQRIDGPDIYNFDAQKAQKNKDSNSVTLPLVSKAGQEESFFTNVEVFKGELDLNEHLMKQEQEEEEKESNKKTYTPLPQAVPSSPNPYSQPRASRQTTWVSSH